MPKCITIYNLDPTNNRPFFTGGNGPQALQPSSGEPSGMEELVFGSVPSAGLCQVTQSEDLRVKETDSQERPQRSLTRRIRPRLFPSPRRRMAAQVGSGETELRYSPADEHETLKPLGCTVIRGTCGTWSSTGQFSVSLPRGTYI